MKPTITDTRPNIIYSSSDFVIRVHIGDTETYIYTKFFTEEFSTLEFFNTVNVLKAQIPGVLETICHNDLNLPFCEEVKNTELAHLFEHILIQELADARNAQGNYKDYSGETAWDWTADEKGVFHVTISATSEDLDIIEESCNKSVGILSEILSSKVSKKTKQARISHLPV